MNRQEYFSRPETSRSLLNTLNEDPRQALNYITYGSNVSGNAIDIGDALDCHMFDGDEEFHKRFYVMEVQNPFPDKTVNAGKFMQECLNLIRNNDTKGLDYQTVFEIAYERTGMKRPNLSDMTDQFIANGGELYLDAIKQIGDRIVISPEDYELHMKMKEALEKTEGFRDLFKGEDACVKYQVVHIWDNKKVMLDIIFINHPAKTIYPMDLKTTSSDPNTAVFSMLKYGYYLQAGMYHDGIVNWAKINYPDYTVSNTFDFIFVQKLKEPRVFGLRIEGDDLTKCKEGGVIRGRQIKGYKQLEEELNWHIENDKWDLPKDFYDSGKIRTIQLFDNADTGS